MPTLLKFALATAVITATLGIAQAQQASVPQGRAIEVIPPTGQAQNEAAQAQTVAQASTETPAEAAPEQAPTAEAPAAEAPAAETPAAAPAPAPAAQAPKAVPPAARAQVPVKPKLVPAPKKVEKCADETPVYGHRRAPGYGYHYAPRYDYAPRYSYGGYGHGGYGYRRGY